MNLELMKIECLPSRLSPGCLKKAEELEPGFYSKNLVLLAKTLIALKKENELAKESLKKVLTDFEQSTKWDDVEVSLDRFRLEIFEFTRMIAAISDRAAFDSHR